MTELASKWKYLQREQKTSRCVFQVRPAACAAGLWELQIIFASVPHAVMRVDDEFLGHPGIERLVRLGCLRERNQLDIYRLRNLDAIMKDRHHEAAVVFHHRRLTRRKGMGLCPSESESHREVPALRSFVLGAGIFGDVEAGNTDRSCRACRFH